MCGLFGTTLPNRYPSALLRREAAVKFLGALAEERGREHRLLHDHESAERNTKRW